MQQLPIAFPVLEIGQTGVVQIRHELNGHDITVFITTPGGTTVSVPLRRGGDIGITAGRDAGGTTVTVNIEGPTGERTFN